MTSWSIFKHAVTLTAGHWRIAVKIVVPFIIVGVIMKAIIFLYAIYAMAGEPSGTVWSLIIAAYVLFCVISFLWIAVSWHRFILIDEYPQSIPVFHGDRIASYFGCSLLIGLITAAPLIPLALLNGIIGVADGAVIVGLIVSVAGILALSIMTMRLMTLLPGAALGDALSIQDMWQVTKGQNRTFLGLSILLFLIAIPFQLISRSLSQISIVFSGIWDIVSDYALLMLGLSVLTTLYGHYVEKRPLVGGDQAVP